MTPSPQAMLISGRLFKLGVYYMPKRPRSNTVPRKLLGSSKQQGPGWVDYVDRSADRLRSITKSGWLRWVGGEAP